MTPSAQFVSVITLPLTDNDVIKTHKHFTVCLVSSVLEALPLTSRKNKQGSIYYLPKTFREKTKQPEILLSPALC